MSVLGKAIRAKCMNCCCQQANDVRNCIVKQCPLHPFRMGKNLLSNHKGNPAALQKAKRKSKI